MKEITNYPGYKITRNGQVWSEKSKRFLKLRSDRGYLRIYIYGLNGIRRNVRIHRLVAETYLPNPNNLKTVNHIDGNKSNNDVSNLEWLSHKDNMKHAYDEGLIIRHVGKETKLTRRVRHIDTGREYVSIREAARQSGDRWKLIDRHVRGEVSDNQWEYV